MKNIRLIFFGNISPFQIKKGVVNMTFRKDDTMYYRDKITKLIHQAKQNGLKVVGGTIPNGIKIYFEAPNGDIMGINLTKE